MKQPALIMLASSLSLVALLAAGQRLPPARPVAPPVRLLVITDVNVVDVVDGEVLRGRMVVVQDGCITSIGTKAPGGRAVRRLDGRGKYLVPGLWDTHVQAPVTAARERKLLTRLVCRGITSICYFSPLPSQPALLATRRTVESGEQLGPRMILAGATSGWAVPNESRSDDLLVRLAGLVAAGCSPAEALRTATVAPAAAAGYRYTLGQVAPDFRADLLLLDANPLADIHHLQQVRAVVLRGRVFDWATLQALRDESQAALPLSAKAAVAH